VRPWDDLKKVMQCIFPRYSLQMLITPKGPQKSLFLLYDPPVPRYSLHMHFTSRWLKMSIFILYNPTFLRYSIFEHVRPWRSLARYSLIFCSLTQPFLSYSPQFLISSSPYSSQVITFTSQVADADKDACTWNQYIPRKFSGGYNNYYPLWLLTGLDAQLIICSSARKIYAIK